MDSKSLTYYPGDTVGPYRIEAEMARGGQGLVLRAQHVQGQRVALKVLLDDAGPAFRRFQNEVSVLSRLSHPNLPRIFDTGYLEGRPFAAMQLIEGGSLAQRLKLRGPLPVAEAVEVLSEVADALEYCHSLGIYHRDLKPGNIVVDAASGRPYLVDFGILKHEKSYGAISLDGATRLSMTGEVVGTICYMAPEQGGDSDIPVCPPTDVYGLAATLFDLWTGRPPFKGETAYNTLLAVINDPPPDPRSLRPEIPALAAAVCLRGLAKYPDERPPSPRLFVDELLEALEAPAAPLESQGGARSPLLIGLGVAAVVLAFGVLGALIPVPEPALSPTPQGSLAATSPSPTLQPPPAATQVPSPAAPPLPLGEPGSTRVRFNEVQAARPLARSGPWFLLRDVDDALGFRVDDLEAGPRGLPRKVWPFGWDARAGCLVFERKGESFRVTPTGGEEPSPYPTGFGLVEFGALRVAAFADGRLVAFDSTTPGPPAWTARAPRNRALPLPLDLDHDGAPEHLLVCTRGGRALLLDGRGQVLLDQPLPTGVDQSAILVEALPGRPPVVVVPCTSGIFLCYEVGPERLLELSRIDLMEPIRGAAFPIRVGAEVRGIAAVVQAAGLTVLDAKLSQVRWCGRRSLPNERVLSGPALVDLDRDGTPELAVARFSEGRSSRAWVEVYDLSGEWITGLDAGARDLRMAPGPAPYLFAAGKKGATVWGPWTALPEPERPPSGVERLFANLLGGAWERVQAQAAEIGGAEGVVYSLLAARQQGEPDRRGTVSRDDMELAIGPIMNLYGNQPSEWRLHQLLAPAGHPRPSYPPPQPLPHTQEPPKPDGRVGVEFTKEGVVAYGAQSLSVARFNPKRRVFGTASWIRFAFPVAHEGPKDLVFWQEVFRHKDEGYAEVWVSIDGRPVQAVSCYLFEQGWLRVPLGVVTPGEHRIELELRRTTAVTRIAGIFVETAKE